MWCVRERQGWGLSDVNWHDVLHVAETWIRWPRWTYCSACIWASSSKPESGKRATYPLQKSSTTRINKRKSISYTQREKKTRKADIPSQPSNTFSAYRWRPSLWGQLIFELHGSFRLSLRTDTCALISNSWCDRGYYEYDVLVGQPLGLTRLVGSQVRDGSNHYSPRRIRTYLWGKN